MLKEGFIVGQLLEDLQAEIDSGGPGKTWYGVFQEKLKSIAGNWPPKDFVQFEPDAINPTRWKYSEKLDLAQKLFEEQILAPERKVKVISFVLSGESDGSIKRNISKVVNQFLNEITKGADDKRVFELLSSRFEKLGMPVGSIRVGHEIGPGQNDEYKASADIKRILLKCKDRLPNAFLPAGEGERESPIWSPTGYDSIVKSILDQDIPLTEGALRGGISGALAGLRLALYYVDDTPEAAWHDEKVVLYGEEVQLVSTTDLFQPLENAVANEEFELANSALSRLSSDSLTLLSHISASSNKVNLAASMGLSRGTVDKREKQLVREVNSIFGDLTIPDTQHQRIRSLMLKRVAEPPEKRDLNNG
jgi:hypothetical protein